MCYPANQIHCQQEAAKQVATLPTFTAKIGAYTVNKHKGHQRQARRKSVLQGCFTAKAGAYTLQ